MDIVSTLGLIVTVVSTIACPIIAHNKGRSAIGWVFRRVVSRRTGLNYRQLSVK